MGQDCYEAVVSSAFEAARFDTVFFRYVELNADAASGGMAIVHSIPEGQFERKTVLLWSPSAAADFAAMWRRLA